MNYYTFNSKQIQEVLIKNGYFWNSLGNRGGVNHLNEKYVCFEYGPNTGKNLSYCDSAEYLQHKGDEQFISHEDLHELLTGKSEVKAFLDTLPKQVTMVEYNGVVYKYTETRKHEWVKE